MAHTLQLPNNVNFDHINYLSENSTERSAVVNTGKWNDSNAESMYNYFQKMTDLSPTLTFQSDIFYPNATAAVSSMTTEPGRLVLGCKGHQVQSDFCLQPRVPVALPLLQYPSPVVRAESTSTKALEHQDICAIPVLNWENYMHRTKNDLRTRWRGPLLWPITSKKPSELYKPWSVEQKEKMKRKRWEKKYENVAEEERPPWEEMETESEEDGDDEDDFSVEGKVLQRKKSNKKKKIKMHEVKKSALHPTGCIKKTLFEIDEDLTLNELEKKAKKQRELKELEILGRKPKKKLQPIKKRKLNVEPLKKKYDALNKVDYSLLPLPTLRTFKNIPRLRVEATWNYFYGGANGACCVMDNRREKCIDVFVGCRTQLRKVRLEKSPPSSILTYKVEAVWEEDKSDVPTNNREGHTTDPLSDVIFQIVPHKFDLVGVRRGRSVELYSTEESDPYLLDSIPNICYGTRKYPGWKKNSAFDVVKDPMLFGLDFNPQYGPEFITVDENRHIRIGDLYKGKTLSTYDLTRTPRYWPNFKQWPKYLNINDGCGVSFCQNGQTFLSWADSKVVLGDRRDLSVARCSMIEIFDLRRSTSSLAWSDQKFYNDVKMELNEYISAVKPSGREFYYYTGTTSRIMLMDIRVPGQPVIKMSHGMRSAAAYLETYTDDNFETIVAASQRVPSTFCAITNHAHTICATRPLCEARNPVLHCQPRSLSSGSYGFFETVEKIGITCPWEADHQRSKGHNQAWATGLALLKTPSSKEPLQPNGIVVLTANSFGDVFCQEWDQHPIEPHRKTEVRDFKFTSFLEQWRDAMVSKSKPELLRPTLNTYYPFDGSLIVETAARNVTRSAKVRTHRFNPLAPREVVHHDVLKHQVDLQTQLEKLSVYKNPIAEDFLEVWKEDFNSSVHENIKQEVVEGDGNIMNTDDGTYDVEVLESQNDRKERRIMLNLEDVMRPAEQINPNPSNSQPHVQIEADDINSKCGGSSPRHSLLGFDEDSSDSSKSELCDKYLDSKILDKKVSSSSSSETSSDEDKSSSDESDVVRDQICDIPANDTDTVQPERSAIEPEFIMVTGPEDNSAVLYDQEVSEPLPQQSLSDDEDISEPQLQQSLPDDEDVSEPQLQQSLPDDAEVFESSQPMESTHDWAGQPSQRIPDLDSRFPFSSFASQQDPLGYGNELSDFVVSSGSHFYSQQPVPSSPSSRSRIVKKLSARRSGF